MRTRKGSQNVQTRGQGGPTRFPCIALHVARGAMSEDWMAVIIGLTLVALVAVRAIAHVPW